MLTSRWARLCGLLGGGVTGRSSDPQLLQLEAPHRLSVTVPFPLGLELEVLQLEGQFTLPVPAQMKGQRA